MLHQKLMINQYDWGCQIISARPPSNRELFLALNISEYI